MIFWNTLLSEDRKKDHPESFIYFSRVAFVNIQLTVSSKHKGKKVSIEQNTVYLVQWIEKAVRQN